MPHDAPGMSPTWQCVDNCDVEKSKITLNAKCPFQEHAEMELATLRNFTL